MIFALRHNITRIMKSGHAARMGKKRNAYRLSVENLRKRGHLQDLHVDGRIVLKLINTSLFVTNYGTIVTHAPTCFR